MGNEDILCFSISGMTFSRWLIPLDYEGTPLIRRNNARDLICATLHSAKVLMNMWNDLPADVVTDRRRRLSKTCQRPSLKTPLDGRQDSSNNTHCSSVFTSILWSLLRNGFELDMRYLCGLGNLRCNCMRLPPNNSFFNMCKSLDVIMPG